MNIVGIIPARMGSSRFPGKPLAKIKGIPMVGHVYFRSKMTKSLNEVYVATCDEEIKAYVESIGGKAVMTSDKHDRCVDRCREAMLKIEEETGEKIDIVVMIQGDEPMVYPNMMDEAVKPLLDDENIMASNLTAPLKTKEEQADPNEVKVVFDKQHFALYFSREPIPSWKKGAKTVPMFKQVCIMPIRGDFLNQFSEWEQTPLEIVESVDMMRIVENGYKLKLVPTMFDTYSVDTQHDLDRVEQLMENDELLKKYAK